jgi:hypothetical protein
VFICTCTCPTLIGDVVICTCTHQVGSIGFVPICTSIGLVTISFVCKVPLELVKPTNTLLEILSFATHPCATMCNKMSPMTTNGCLCNCFSNLDEVWYSFQLSYNYELFHL